jgi:endo-alpha-1,4-polygalactosaminidase (GH114 family)
MSESFDPPIPYKTSYAEKVRTALKTLLLRAKERGRIAEVVAAVNAIDKSLRIYPQFGEPLFDLKHMSATVCILSIPPLVVRYALDEEHRLVSVASPLQLFSNSGLEP